MNKIDEIIETIEAIIMGFVSLGLILIGFTGIFFLTQDSVRYIMFNASLIYVACLVVLNLIFTVFKIIYNRKSK